MYLEMEKGEYRREARERVGGTKRNGLKEVLKVKRRVGGGLTGRIKMLCKKRKTIDG